MTYWHKIKFYISIFLLNVTFGSFSFAESNTQKNFKQILSLTLNSYKYEEPNLMKLEGTGFGIDYLFRKNLKNFFMEANFSYSASNNKYTSNNTGFIENEPTWYIDSKFFIGYTFLAPYAEISLSPYIGIGYRYLNNDTNNIPSSTGAYGYLRTNQLSYIPIGVIYSYKILNNKMLELQCEYDHLLRGTQFSGLKNKPTIYNGLQYTYQRDAINEQNKGYGINASATYIMKNMSVGPFVKYWNIDDSTIDNVPIGTGILKKGMYEPNNNTFEIGIKLSLIF